MASKPDAVKILCEAGLNSIRVSTNSARREIYMPYYRPNNYDFDDIVESLKVVNSFGGWTSINYFVFPGMTDSVAEYEALRKLIKETGLKMIQWRNFNIDPDWYLGKIGVTDTGECLGMKQLMELIHEEFPQLKFGYFNPPIERIKGSLKWILHMKIVKQSGLYFFGFAYGRCPVQQLCLYRRTLYHRDQPRIDRHHFFTHHVDHSGPYFFKRKNRLAETGGDRPLYQRYPFSLIKR